MSNPADEAEIVVAVPEWGPKAYIVGTHEWRQRVGVMREQARYKVIEPAKDLYRDASKKIAYTATQLKEMTESQLRELEKLGGELGGYAKDSLAAIAKGTQATIERVAIATLVVGGVTIIGLGIAGIGGYLIWRGT